MNSGNKNFAKVYGMIKLRRAYFLMWGDEIKKFQFVEPKAEE